MARPKVLSVAFLNACSRCGDRIRALGGGGILRDHELEDLAEAVVAVLDLMLDGVWHRTADICDVARSPREGLRRMRELRALGLTVDKRRRDDEVREYEYRLRVDPDETDDGQLSLFRGLHRSSDG